MKKIIFFSAAFMLLSFAACKKEDAKLVEQKSSANVNFKPESNVSYFNLDQPKFMDRSAQSLIKNSVTPTCVTLKVNLPGVGSQVTVTGPGISNTFFSPINNSIVNFGGVGLLTVKVFYSGNQGIQVYQFDESCQIYYLIFNVPPSSNSNVIDEKTQFLTFIGGCAVYPCSTE